MSSPVVASAIPSHLYRDARLANTAGVKKRTFWVFEIALLRMTYVKINNCKHIFQTYTPIKFKRVNSLTLTLDLSVDKIRLTVDTLSSFRPVAKMCGRSSNPPKQLVINASNKKCSVLTQLQTWVQPLNLWFSYLALPFSNKNIYILMASGME